MNTFKHYLLGVMSLFFATTMAQNVISGHVTDGETKISLPEASVQIKGTSQGTVTNFNGKFELKTAQQKGALVVSFVGFQTQEVPFNITNGKAMLEIALLPDMQTIDEVVVTGNSLIDIAKERKTPVAVSTLRAAEITERLGTKEFPELLNRTPSVYATKTGGGFGDAKISIRGFGNENIAVMVNGMPVNDMENSKVYWSNWAGLSDVTSAMQVQRGLGASKIAISSVGGTINIITRAADMQQGGNIVASYGGVGEYKVMASYNTGKSAKGLSASVLMSRNWGKKYADGTNFEGYNYFLALGYEASEKHNFQLMMTGAPQWHHQRYNPIKISDYAKYGGDNKIPNRKYNSYWGYLKGEEYSTNRNAYHKPVFMLNWDWKMSDASSMSTVAYASMGRGWGSRIFGSVNGKRTFDDFRNSNGLVDFDQIYRLNQASTPDSGVMVRGLSVNSHDWYGVLSNFNHKINENFTFNMGFDGRYYYGYHYQILNDLLGGSAFKDNTNKNLSAPRYITYRVGDKPIYNPFGTTDPIAEHVAFSNDGEVRWGGIFGQLEYSDEQFSAFIQGSSSIQGFQRIDNFLKEGTLAEPSKPNTAMKKKTGFKELVGYNVKGGVNYNINEHHNVFVNAGYYSKQPFFDAVYWNMKNYLNPKLTNEKILGLEAGYGFKHSLGNLNLNLYRTSWKDRYNRARNRINNITAYADIQGMSELHQGIEIEGTIRPSEFLSFHGSFSIGDWFYQGNAEASLYDESYNPLNEKGEILSQNQAQIVYLDGVKVGESAQMTASLGMSVSPVKNLKINADWRYVNNLYAKLNVLDFTNKKATERGSLKLPSYNLFDLGASYKWNISQKYSLTFYGNIDNLLDTDYIAESNTNIFVTEKTTATYKGLDVNNEVYFGIGRTWNAGIRFHF